MIDYAVILERSNAHSPALLVDYLRSELPHKWLEDYHGATAKPTNVLQFQHGTFTYVYDHYAELEATGAVPVNPMAESRLVVVYGTTAPRVGGRDDYRLRGWVGRTERIFGRGWDKGHFIANSIGGIVDGLEANVFLQRRDVNRGWGSAGRRYRTMERFCCENPGRFCFSRPLYTDDTSRPSEIEFGILKSLDHIWVERFPNVYPDALLQPG
jgi:hypothetical protein